MNKNKCDKVVLILSSLILTPFSLLLFLIVSTIAYFYVISQLPVSLTNESSKELILSTTSYLLPENAEIIYAKKFWINHPEPSSACIVLRLNDSDFARLIDNKSFKKVRYRDKDDFPGKGCATFRSKIGEHQLGNFEKITHERNGVKGYIVYVDKASHKAMFELYSYD
jgi:hypothetical protein